MKQKLLKLTAFILCAGPIGYIFGMAGSSDHELVTNKQAFIGCIIALIILAADSKLIDYLGRKEKEKCR